MDDKTAEPQELTDREMDIIVGGNSVQHFYTEAGLSIGRQSAGAGAGKITFNPF
jgi:hypothetical protein